MTPSDASISVVTRTYNRPEFLKRACRGLAGQTCKDFEWIIVNDGGDRNAIDDISPETCGAAHGVRIVDLENNGGRAAAAIAGMEAAAGAYCLIHDDDDEILPEALEKMRGALLADPALVGCICGHETVEEKFEGGELVAAGKPDAVIPKTPPLLMELAYRNTILTVAAMFRRDVYTACGGINPELDVLEDWDLWLRMMLDGDFGVAPEVLARQYVRHEDPSSPSAQSSLERHREVEAKLRNRYLRADIKAGQFGLGVIMNIHHRQTLEEMAQLTDRLKGVKRLLRL